jgi:putative transcriptional regulator
MRIMPKHSDNNPSSKPGTTQDKPAFPESSSVSSTPHLNLANHFLIAMPSMLDPVFGGTVIYLCEHNANGALGVIINKPTDMTMDVLLDRIDLKLEIAPNQIPLSEKTVMFGGPVQVERGFVLHTPLRQFSSMMKVTDEVTLTTSKDVLEAVAAGKGPQRVLVTLGCAGWSAGQLEDEIARNGWLTVPADPSILFELPIAERFAAAIRLLGIDPMMLASEAGHA